MLGALIGGGSIIADVGPQFTWLRGAWLGFVLVGYEPLFTSLGATVGQRAMGYRVRRQTDQSRPIAIPAAYLRFVVKILLGVISFFTMSFSRQQRAIHDMAAGSVVITWPPDPNPGEEPSRATAD